MIRVIVLIGVLLVFSCGRLSEENEGLEEIDSLKTEIAELQQANDTLSEHLMKRAYVTRNYPRYFDSIPQPEEFLLQNLQKNPSLIPKDAVLGGTMRFTNVKFVDDELLVAEYEDGHVMGKAIYSYSLTRNGQLDFELVGTIK